MSIAAAAFVRNPNRSNFLLVDITNQFNPIIISRWKRRLTLITSSSSSSANALTTVDFNPLQSALEKVYSFPLFYVSLIYVSIGVNGFRNRELPFTEE